MGFTGAHVLGTRPLSSRLRRITLDVHDPVALDVPAGPDTAVAVYPTADPHGPTRCYTVRHGRRADGRLQLDLDVVAHGPGTGSSWAAAVQPGERVGLDFARTWYRPEPQTDFQLIVADLAGLPAAARILAELPADAVAVAVVEVAERADCDYLPRHPGVEVVAAVGSGNGQGPSRLAAGVAAAFSRPGRGYCWLGAEASEARAVRKFLRAQGWSVDQMDISGYWRHRSESWDRRHAPRGAELFAVYTRAIAAGRGPRAAAEEYDEALERTGF